MRDVIRRSDRAITAAGELGDHFLESIFFTGNGRMGARGYTAFRSAPRPTEVGLFIAGVFDTWKPGITDIVSLPTPIWHELLVDGAVPDVVGDASYHLCLASGVLTIGYTLTAGGKRLHVTEERLLPFHAPAALLQRLRVRAESDLRLDLKSGVDLSCKNQPIPDDQVKECVETVRLVALEPPVFGASGVVVRGATKTSAIGFALSVDFRSADFQRGEPFDTEDGAGFFFRLDAKAGTDYTLCKTASVTTGRDVDPLIGPPDDGWSWEALFERAQEDWRDYWARVGVEIGGDDDAQSALRYHMFQLRCNCPQRDDTVSIGARGLTHTRYKGCYFWDTDFFVMPYFLLTEPAAARNLMKYRINTLPQAKAHARKMSGAGARFPWMVSLDGDEQCETWDIGCCEVHVTADVAFAMGQYLAYTGDDALFFDGGAELLIETARFWVSRYSLGADGSCNLFWCKGPDEYCGASSNNLFTNRMVQHNLTLALCAAARLEAEDAAQYRALAVTDDERAGWEALRAAIPLPRDPETGRLRQDDTLHRLEPVDISALKAGDAASYHAVCFDRLQRYKVIKQADVLLLMTRMPHAFSAAEKRAAWEDFEPICLHDSTLSFATHALFAYQNRCGEKGGQYLEKALFLDLRDVMHNTGKEGLHLANLGESWQAVLFGIAGLHLTEDGLSFAPNLPPHWTSLSFRVTVRGQRYAVNITPDGTEVAKVPETAE